MPAMIRRTPIIALANPRFVATVQIKGIVIAHNNLEALAQQILQHWMACRLPKLEIEENCYYLKR